MGSFEDSEKKGPADITTESKEVKHVGADLSKPLPTEVVLANSSHPERPHDRGPDAITGAFVQNGAGAIGHSFAPPKMDAEYYAKWREDTQAKLDRGEDYYEDFARRARERTDNSVTGKLINGIRGKLGRKKSGGREHGALAQVDGK